MDVIDNETLYVDFDSQKYNYEFTSYVIGDRYSRRFRQNTRYKKFLGRQESQ